MSDYSDDLKTKLYTYCDNECNNDDNSEKKYNNSISSNYSNVKKIYVPKKYKSNKHKKKSIQIDFNINDTIKNQEIVKKTNELKKTNINDSKYQNIYIFQCNCQHEHKTNNSLNHNVNLLFSNYNGEIKNNEFIGDKCISKNFLDCVYFFPFDGIINKLAINIKSYQNPGIYTIRLYINGKPTLINTSILDGSDNLSSISETSLEINSTDLLSFRSEITNDNILKNGISITLVYSLKN
jgi:hypothetical protein